MAFHRFAARPPLDHHRCFHCCFHTPPSPRSLQPASDQTDRCLPRHRQAVRVRCFCHWRVTDAFHRCFRLALHRGERASLMSIAWSVFSSFSLENDQWIKRGHFIVLRRVRHWIITAVSTVVSTPRLPPRPLTRSRPGRLLSAKARAGGELAVFLPLACHRCFH